MKKQFLISAKKYGKKVLSSVPFSIIRNLSDGILILPFYHVVSDEDVPHAKHLYSYRNVKEFKRDIDFFLKYYTPVSLRDLMDFLDNLRSLPERGFLITFDDGLRETFEVILPILKEKGVPATFFLCSAFIDNKKMFFRHKVSILIDFVLQRKKNIFQSFNDILKSDGIKTGNIKDAILSMDKADEEIIDRIASRLDCDFKAYLKNRKPYLDSEQIGRLIKEGFTIGAHSIDHPSYGSLSFEEQLNQTTESIRQIKEKFSLDYSAFAFPYDDTGVSKRYFEYVFYESKCIDISFGMSGMRTDAFERHLQRFPAEHKSLSPEKVLSLQYVVKMARLFTGKNTIKRY